MRKDIREMRISNLDIENPSKAKRERWAEIQTDELKKLYANIQSKIKNIPKEQWTAWDIESVKQVEAILADRQADEIRKDIERILELAGMSYGVERAAYFKKQKLQKNIKNTGENT